MSSRRDIIATWISEFQKLTDEKVLDWHMFEMRQDTAPWAEIILRGFPMTELIVQAGRTGKTAGLGILFGQLLSGERDTLGIEGFD